MTDTHPYAGTYSHQIIYNKALSEAWDYFGYDMGSGYDYSAYSHFGFYIYSVLNNTQIQINLLDDDTDEMRYAGQTVNQGAGWKQMSWQLSTGTFVANGDGSFEWDRVRRILFYIWGGNGVATGIFRMDEMQFYTTALTIPTLDAVSDPGLDGRYDLDWNDIAGVALYEIWEEDNFLFVDANSNAGSGWTSSWPGDSIQAFDNSASDGTTFYYKVRAWTAAPADGGACSLWSDAQSITIDILDAPVLNDITDDGDSDNDGSYTVSWSEPPGANVYQLQESRAADFATCSETQTTEAFAAMSHTESADTWHYRVKSWTALPEDSGDGSIWSGTKSINLDPAVPVMDRISDPEKDGIYTLTWTNPTNGTLFELQQSEDSTFNTGVTTYWPDTTSQDITVTIFPGTIYYRVRAWTRAAVDGGVATGWSSTRSLTYDAGGSGCFIRSLKDRSRKKSLLDTFVPPIRANSKKLPASSAIHLFSHMPSMICR